MQQTSQRRVPARRRKLSLECKLAAYALATGAILATPDQAPADIIYSGVVDQPVGYNTSFNIDLNGDGTTDFTIITSQILYVQAPGNNAVVITPPDAAAALNPFDEISANDQLGRGRRLMAFYTGGGTGPSGTRPSGGPWLGAQNKFLGLRFNFPDGSTHYGWARLSVGFDYPSFSFTATVHDWAYENTPDKPILAGDTIGSPAPPPPAPPPSPVPEPSPLALLARGAAGVEIHLRNHPCPSALPGNSSWSAGMPPTGK
jgi:hypothetical protein